MDAALQAGVDSRIHSLLILGLPLLSACGDAPATVDVVAESDNPESTGTDDGGDGSTSADASDGSTGAHPTGSSGTTGTAGSCGDGSLDEGEDCDDGNTDLGDGCDENCHIEEVVRLCGDGEVDRGEECDDGNGEDADACLSSCRAASCGDGVVWEGKEGCDDGNAEDTDGCSSDCQVASCGDGLVWRGQEACDDGNADDTDECLSTCELASCGDGAIWEGQESCDDGNLDDDDGCSAECVSEFCGNGLLELAEECDDGDDNATPGSDCFDDCLLVDFEFGEPLTYILDNQDSGDGPRTVYAVDFNADGVLDLFTNNTTSSDNTVLYGFGDGRFWAPHRRLTESEPHDVEVGDLNGDGRLDAVVANAGSDSVTVFLGEGVAFGPGSSTSVQHAGDGLGPAGVAVADIDGDGALDVVSANQESDNVSILLGDGIGGLLSEAVYATSTGSDGAGPVEVRVADVNNDGELDIVTCNSSSHDVSLLPGLGMGTFGAPTTFSTQVDGGGDGPGALELTDVSGDGVPDVVVASPVSNDVIVLIANPGTGFEPPSRLSIEGDRPSGLALGDVDGDGELDVVTANLGSDDVSVLLGAGDGSFSPSATYGVDEVDVVGTAGDGPRGIRLADMDGDGDLDIVTSNTVSDDVSILRNDGAGLFGELANFESRIGYSGEEPGALAVGDVNDDGILDVVVANLATDDLTAVAGLGNGVLAPSQTTPVMENFFPSDSAAGDLDGDGRMDWVTEQGVVLRRGFQGVTGQFFTSDFMIGSNPEAISLADLDGDADLDIITGGFFSFGISRLLNDGTGNFGTIESFDAGSNVRSVELAEVTGDGNIDAVVCLQNADTISIFPGTGTGNFASANSFSTAQGASGDSPFWIDVADVDGDGLLDVVTANQQSNDVSYLANLGGGVFDEPIVVPATFVASDADTFSVAVGDFNGDGEADLAASHRNLDTFSIMFGFGGGSFSAPQEFPTGNHPMQIKAADFNGDGLDDVVTVDNFDDSVTVHLSVGH